MNYKKISFIPINIQEEDMHWIEPVMGFTKAEFLCTYLGMPLTIKTPNRALFLPLIDKIEKKARGVAN